MYSYRRELYIILDTVNDVYISFTNKVGVLVIKIPALVLPTITGADIQSEFLHYYTLGANYRYQMQEDEQFYLGNQFSAAQVNYLRRLGQSEQPNNKIKPAMEQVLANTAASSPLWETIPTGMTDNKMSYVVNRQMEEIWSDSDGDKQFRKNAKDFGIKGKAVLYGFPSWNADGGLGAFRLMRLNPNNVFNDPSCSLSDNSNGISVIYSDIETKKSLVAQHPQWEAKIKKANNMDAIENETMTLESQDEIGEGVIDWKEERLRKYFRFARVSVAYAKVTFLDTGYWRIYDDENYKKVAEGKKYKEALRLKQIQEKVVWKTHYRQTLFMGDQEMEDGVLPVSVCPIQEAWNEDTDNPYPSGDVRQAKAPQRKLNRTEALIIAHATATAGIKYGFEEGAIEQDQLIKLNLPGGIPIRFNPGGLSAKKFHQFGVTPVNSELYNEKAKYTNDIQEIFAAYKFLQGDASGSPGTVGEAAILDEAAARKQNWKMLPLYDMLTNIGRLALQWMPYIYDEQRILRLVNPDGKEENVILNSYVNNDGVVKKIYDMRSMQVDIRVIVGSARAKDPLSKLRVSKTLLELGLSTQRQEILHLDVPRDKEAILKEIDEVTRLKQTLQQAGEHIKKLTGNLERRENENYHLKMDAKVSNESKKVVKAVSELEAVIDGKKKEITSGDGANA